MLAHYVRFFFALLRALFTFRFKHPLEPGRISVRIMPWDLDFNLHANNSIFLQLMDLGRFGLVCRSGMLYRHLRRGWLPVLSGVTVYYLRPLRPFDKVVLETGIASWNEKYWFLEHRFLVGGELRAVSWEKGAHYKGGKAVPTDRMMEVAGVSGQPPKMPAEMKRWAESRDALASRRVRGPGSGLTPSPATRDSLLQS